jgi:hypothetical protein
MRVGRFFNFSSDMPQPTAPELVAALAQLRDLRGELLDLRNVDLAAGVGENAGPELDHPTPRALGVAFHSGISGRNFR